MIKISASSYYGNIAAISQALSSMNVDVNKLYNQANIDISEYKGGIKRIPNELMAKFVELAIAETDPSISLASVDNLNPASYHALGIGLMYSHSLRSFCLRYERYFSLISTMLTTRFVVGETLSRLETQETVDVSDTVKNFDSDCFATITVKYLRLTLGHHFTPSKISIIWDPSIQIKEKYQNFFNCPIEYSAKTTAIFFDNTTLDNDLPLANLELARQSDKTVTDFLDKTMSVGIESRVYAKLIEFLPSGDCSREKVAQALNMTAPSLHKKLVAINTTYQTLHDTLCKELAEQYIGRDGMSIGEAAYLLGVADCRNFSRSFKRWVGMSPSEYRALHR